MSGFKVNIPDKYMKDYLKTQTERFSSTLQLFAILLMFLFVFGTVSINLIVIHRFPVRFWPTWLFITFVCFLAMVIARKSLNLMVLKLSSSLLMLSALLVVARNHLKSNAPVLMVLGFYVFMLFSFAFPFPWSPLESLIIAGLIISVYTAYYLNIIPHVPVQQESLDFYQGIIILLMAAAVIYFVKRNVTKRFLETYILQMRIKENSDQMKKELELATRVHRRLVPHSFSGKLADIGVSYVPMTYMGGDYAQFRFIDKNKLLFIIADVTGHGVPAALLVNALNAEFERASMEGKNPGEMLKEMDNFIKKDFAETGMYLTAFCGLLDYRGRRFLYSNYGHPPQYVYLAKKHNIMEIYAQTSFLGLPFSDESIYEDQIKFDRGDQIVLFTDGVLEARDRNKEEFGPRRLKRFILDNHVLSAEEFNHELLKRLSSFTGDKYNDDIFILNIRTK